jgi:NADH-quinone oxidoreductase subunit L
VNAENILPWIVLLLPLAAAVWIALFTRRDGRLSAQFSIAAIVVSFVLSVILFGLFSGKERVETRAVEWLALGDLSVSFGITLDPLSLLMLLIVTGVGSAIHIYSYGYMHGDPGMGRYFAGLSLFTFSMTGIVLASDFVQMFVFWELVGLSSYLLIGFWYDRPSAADACKKAFITNRLGDFGFLLGIILTWSLAGSVQFDAIGQQLKNNPNLFGSLSCVVGLLIFCGAMGKSAQFPLHVWLPHAMEGPTPVSALIHAATMVAAGVYMLCRVFFIYKFSTPAWPENWTWLHGISALEIIGWIGGFTAFLAALIACQQNDIKRILAYSTLSQLGYMIMGVGLAAFSSAMYHLTTHAFFKALLFLAAGSVIHVLHHEQNIWEMGGLRTRMRTTYRTFLVGTLALAGFPLLSGFYSKDSILGAAAQRGTGSVGLFILGSVVAMLTAFYMFRLLFVAFLGVTRSENAAHAHESPGVMKWPLVALAVPTILAGYWGIQPFLDRQFNPGQTADYGSWLEEMFAPFGHAPLAALASLGALAFGFSAALALYRKATIDPLVERLGGLARPMRNRFYFDELYDKLIAITHEMLARVADWFDRWIIASGAIKGISGITDIFGRALRLAQTGNLQTYAFLFALGVAVVLLLFL